MYNKKSECYVYLCVGAVSFFFRHMGVVVVGHINKERYNILW